MENIGKVAFLFGPQGSQFVGMGGDINDYIRTKVFGAAQEVLGYDLWKICRDGPKDLLDKTNICQPAIFTVNHCKYVEYMVMHMIDPEHFPDADIVAGPSLAIWNAYVAAEILAFAEALATVSRRGQLMQKAIEVNPGKMIALTSLTGEIKTREIKGLCGKFEIFQTNSNSAYQVVLGGKVKNIDSALEAIGAWKKYVIKKLPVSGAFHTPLMAEAAEEMEGLMESLEMRTPKKRVVKNTTGKSTGKVKSLREEGFAHLTKQVLWKKSIQEMAKEGVTGFKVFEPKPTIARFTDESLKEKRFWRFLSSELKRAFGLT